MDRAPACTPSDSGARWWVPTAVMPGVLGVVAVESALRAAGATWWAARGGEASAAWVLVDALGPAALAVLLFGAGRTTARQTGWPLRTLLLVSVAVMQPIGYVLAFGFRDVGLASAWACVQAMVLVAVAMLERRPRRVLVTAVALAATLAFAASLLALS
jgi:hypothetical protein